MARYQVTSPDGQKYEITAPDNATQEQVMGYARQQFESAKPSNAGVALSGLNKGAAAILDSIADIGPNAMNLAKAAVGFPLAAAGRVDLAEKIGATDMLEPVSPARRALEFAGAGQVKPANATQRRIDYAAQALPSVMLSPGVGLAKNAALTGISGLATGEAQEQTGSTVGALMAGMLAPMGAQAVAGTVKRGMPVIRQPFTASGRELMVGDFLRGNMSGIDPKAALAARKPLVSGSKPTTAQLTAEAGDKRLLGYEKQLAQDTATRQQFDDRYAANRDARAGQMRRVAPMDEGAAVVQQKIRDDVARQQAAADARKANAAGSRDWAMGQTGQQVSDLQAGQQLASVYDDLDAQLRRQNSLNYDIDPFNSVTGLSVPTQRIGQIVDDVYAGVTKAAPGSVRESLGIVSQVATPPAITAPQKTAKPVAAKYGANVVNPQTDDILTAIAKRGGLSREQAQQFGIDPAELNKRAGHGKPVFPKSGGVPFDRMAEELSQDGYPVMADGSYSPYALADALDEAMRGRRVLTPQGHEYDMAMSDWNQNKGPVFGDDLRLLETGDLQMSYRQMKVAASRIGELERQSMMSGDRQAAMALGQIKQAMRQSMDDAVELGRVTPDIADAYRHATQQYAQYASRMKEGVAGNLRYRNTERNIKLETVPKAFLQSGEEAFRSFQRSIGPDPTATATAQDWLSTQWRNSVMTADGRMKGNWKESSAKWMRDNADVMDAFPGLRQRVEYAIAKAGTADALAVRLDAEMKRLGTGTAAKHFLRELNPENSFAAFMKSPNRDRESALMIAIAKRDPEFRRAVAGAMRDHLQAMPDTKFVKFMGVSKNAELIRDLFGDKMLKQFQKVSADARRDMLRTDVNKAAGSDTGANLAARKAMEMISGYIPGAGVLRAVAGRVVDKAMGGMNDTKVRAFLNPEDALRMVNRSAATPDFLETMIAEFRRAGMTAKEAEQRAMLVQAIQQQNEERK